MKKWILFSVAVALMVPAFAKEAPKADQKADIKAKIEARRAENKAKIEAARAAAKAKREAQKEKEEQLNQLLEKYKKDRNSDAQKETVNDMIKLVSEMREAQLKDQAAELAELKSSIENAEERLKREQNASDRERWAVEAVKKLTTSDATLKSIMSEPAFADKILGPRRGHGFPPPAPKKAPAKK